MHVQDSKCVVCQSRLDAVLDYGEVPLVDELHLSRDSALAADRFRLKLCHCSGCSLVQLSSTPPRERLFNADYPYYSSVSDAVSLSARQHAASLIDQRRLGSDSLVIELASNDGYQLRWFAEAGIPVLGIEPCAGPASAARERGINTESIFFDESSARDLREQGRQADVILAKNVLAHVPDPVGFLSGIRNLLKPDGLASVEFPYLGSLIEQCQFDTVYHEHRCYLSVTTVATMSRMAGLAISGIETVELHGGSLRVDLCDETSLHSTSDRDHWLQLEQDNQLNSMQSLAGFAENIDRLCTDIRDLLHQQLATGRRVMAYGAAAKGVILLHRLGIDHKQIDYVADLSRIKQGHYLPGSGLAICSPEDLAAQRPDVCLLLAWNFADEILTQQTGFSNKGCRWLIPVPQPVLR